MLRQMRDASGGPSTRIRLIALVVAVGMLVAAAPLLIPLVDWLLGGFF
ncbi:MAG TPA: hypothetical protein VFR74_11200 [Jiangellales bacterium]|nr:hypothetical protein [Jiangellales bacterium]